LTSAGGVTRVTSSPTDNPLTLFTLSDAGVWSEWQLI